MSENMNNYKSPIEVFIGKVQDIKFGNKYLVCFAFSNEKTADEFTDLVKFLLDTISPKAEDANTTKNEA